MTFFVNLIFSLVFWNALEKYRNSVLLSRNVFGCIVSHLFLIWIFICGSQYYVGTDYPAYISLFNGEGLDFYYYKGEILFAAFIDLCNWIGLRGQSLYYIFYSINFFFLYLILKRIQFKHAYIFILLFITYSNIFNNQLNILRQITAIYIGTYSCMLLLEGKTKKYIFGIFIATLIHTSSIVLYSIYFINKKNIITHSFLKKILIISIIGSIIISPNIFNAFIPYLPIAYSYHISSGNVETYGLTLILTKYMFIPFFWLSLNLIKYNKLSKNETKLFYIGFIGFCFKLCLFKLSIVGRIADYFLIFSIFPLYFYLSYLSKKRSLLFTIIISILILFYAMKTLVFPKSEYLYQSIFFN